MTGFDNVKGILKGIELTFIDFSWFNSILPTVHLWAEGIFWLFYVFYLVDQVYFLIRGVHLFLPTQKSFNDGGK